MKTKVKAVKTLTVIATDVLVLNLTDLSEAGSGSAVKGELMGVDQAAVDVSAQSKSQSVC